MSVMPSPACVFDVSCVLRVHSTYSDGSATVPELLEAARGAGADAVLLTDRDSLQARRDGWEGIHDGVLLVVGTEVRPPKSSFRSHLQRRSARA
jgi:predicted metal-dependent phosphoesterase TrpH